MDMSRKCSLNQINIVLNECKFAQIYFTWTDQLKRTRCVPSLSFRIQFLEFKQYLFIIFCLEFFLSLSEIDINFSTYAFHHITKQWAMNPAAMNKCDIDKKIAWIVHW